MSTVNVKVGLETDGDYSLNYNNLYHMTWDGTGYFQHYSFYDGLDRQVWEDVHTATREPEYRALALLEQMLCDIKIAPGHYYIMDDIFHMFDDAMKAIGRREKSFESSVSGNYEGTFIEVYVSEDNDG